MAPESGRAPRAVAVVIPGRGLNAARAKGQWARRDAFAKTIDGQHRESDPC